MTCYCTAGVDIFSDWVIPEGIAQRRLGDCYQKHPVMSRVIAAPIAVISGIVKTLLFPVICVVGCVAMPIIALVRTCQGKNDGCDWMKGWCFCLLGVALFTTFAIMACYHLPIVATLGIFAASIGVSIIVHVYKLVKEPPKPPIE